MAEFHLIKKILEFKMSGDLEVLRGISGDSPLVNQIQFLFFGKKNKNFFIQTKAEFCLEYYK